MCLKCQKSGCKLELLCRKAKKFRGEGGCAHFFATPGRFSPPLGDFRHPLQISLPPPERNPMYNVFDTSA